MKAVILAAGKGKRMLPLTKNIPKPMVQVHGRPILEHILESLPDEISEYICITGYLEEKIRGYFGNSFNGKKITYITQEKPEGTWRAVKLAEKYLGKNEKFLLINADDLHGREGLLRLVKEENAILVSVSNEAHKFGVVEKDGEGYLVNIEEKPEKPKGNIVATGVYVLNSKIFEYPDPEPINGEYYITNVFNEYKKENRITVVESDFWLPLGTPEDILKAHDII